MEAMRDLRVTFTATFAALARHALAAMKREPLVFWSLAIAWTAVLVVLVRAQ